MKDGLGLGRGAAACLLALFLGGCQKEKGAPTDPGSGDMDKPAGWYRSETYASPGVSTVTHRYYGLLDHGSFQSLEIRYARRPDGDSAPTRIAWTRGIWIAADSQVVMARYRYGIAYDTAGIGPDWQDAFRFTDTLLSSTTYMAGVEGGRLRLRALGAGSDLFLTPAAPPAGLGFDPGKGPAFDIASSDIDRDGLPDRSDPDIDGDKVSNALDCMPFDKYFMVPGVYGDCTYLQAPSNVIARSGDGKVTLSWQETVNGTVEVEVTPESAAGSPPEETVVQAGSAVITGLTNGESYAFSVRVTHGGLTSEAGPLVRCVPLAMPADLRIKSVRDTLELSWDGAGSKSFNVYYQAGDTLTDTTRVVVSRGPPYRFTGLRDGTRYSFAVQGVDSPWRSGISPSRSEVFTSGIKVLDNPWHAPLYHATGLAMAADGTPIVLYSDSSQYASLMVAAYENKAWVPLGPPGIRRKSRQARLLLDAGGAPHVLFRNYETSKLELVQLRSGAWESSGLLEFLDNDDYGFAKANSFDFAIAADGTTYVALSDPARFDHLTILRKAEAGWEVMDRRGFSAGAAGGIRLALGPDGIPHVAFLDAGNDGAPLVKKFNGTRFENLGNPGIVGPQGGLALIVTSAGAPVLAYLHGDAVTAHAAVATFAAGAWSRLGPGAIGPAAELSLAAGKDDRLYLATSRGYVYRYDGSAWPSVGPAQEFAAGAIRNVQVAVNGEGVPYVCHYQAGLVDNVIVRAFDY